ncbi:hypothetical protein BLOT_002832 [Blomia tropicalis]|nr:hypothetical protein BLOT_002832 [Blomia tropicalis]
MLQFNTIFFNVIFMLCDGKFSLYLKRQLFPHRDCTMLACSDDNNLLNMFGTQNDLTIQNHIGI